LQSRKRLAHSARIFSARLIDEIMRSPSANRGKQREVSFNLGVCHSSPPSGALAPNTVIDEVPDKARRHRHQHILSGLLNGPEPHAYVPPPLGAACYKARYTLPLCTTCVNRCQVTAQKVGKQIRLVSYYSPEAVEQLKRLADLRACNSRSICVKRSTTFSKSTRRHCARRVNDALGYIGWLPPPKLPTRRLLASMPP
jgi:hypothetical protein